RSDVTTLRRAAHVHDLGNVSVPDRVWSKSGALNPSEWARVHLHPYHSQRILTVSPVLRASGELAGLHHERIDGSGYHRALPAAALPLSGRLLAAAEAYQSMLEERSWRPALDRQAAAAAVRREVADNKLDRRAVEAVLVASGERSKPVRAPDHKLLSHEQAATGGKNLGSLASHIGSRLRRPRRSAESPRLDRLPADQHVPPRGPGGPGWAGASRHGLQQHRDDPDVGEAVARPLGGESRRPAADVRVSD